MTPEGGRSVAFLLDYAPSVWRSIDEFHFRLGRGLKHRGILPILVYSAPPPPDHAARMHSIGAVIMVLAYNQGLYRYYQGLGKLFRQYRVAAIQTRGFNYFRLLWWMVRLQGVRHMIFLEGNSGLLRANFWKKALLRLRTKALTLPITQIVAVTDFVRNQLIELGMPARAVMTIYNGVDLNRFHADPEARREWRQKHGIRDEEVVISSISYLRAFKNPHVIIEACAALKQRGLPFRLFVAGDGPLLEPMKALAQKVGIANQTCWLGNYPYTEKLLQGSDVFVLASVGEAIGNVLIEAMACGVPSVGTRSGGIPEIIEHPRTGLLAEPLDVNSFANAIERIARDPQLRQQMASRSIQRARDQFDVDLAVQKFLRLYDSLLGP